MGHREAPRRRPRRPRHAGLILLFVLWAVATAFVPLPPRPPSPSFAGQTVSFPAPASFHFHRSGHGRVRQARVNILIARGVKRRSRKPSRNGDTGDAALDVGSDSLRHHASSERFREVECVDGETAATVEGAAPRQTTLSGGPSLIFDMARRMLVWDDELYDSSMLNDAGSRGGGSVKATGPFSSEKLAGASPAASGLLPRAPVASSLTSLPRWRPPAIRQQSISNVNPSFRTSSPVMTSAGYAGILRRNSRKRNKPGMWRHSLRIYKKMGELEKINGDKESAGEGSGTAVDGKAEVHENQIPGVGANLSLSTNARGNGSTMKKMRIRRSTAHHEAALVAASKLGMWEEALLIFRAVEASSSLSPSAGRPPENGQIRVTENMILSVISACVRGARAKSIAKSTNVISDISNNDNNGRGTITTDQNSRRRPLDMAREIVLSMEERYDVALVSHHINPLAAAYVRLGLRAEAVALINKHLEDRSPPSPAPATKARTTLSKKYKQWKEKGERLTSDNPSFESVEIVDWSDSDLDDGEVGGVHMDNDLDGGHDEETRLNVRQMKSKDRGSYSLLVHAAVAQGDWTGAVRELQRMTDAGFHPNKRNMSCWAEAMERGCRPSGNGDVSISGGGMPNYYDGRRKSSWKKKRDEIWMGGLR